MQNNTQNDKNIFPKTHEECGCTHEKFVASLEFLTLQDIKELLIQGYVEGTCQLCGTDHRIEKEELEIWSKEHNIDPEKLCSDEACSSCVIECDSRIIE